MKLAKVTGRSVLTLRGFGRIVCLLTTLSMSFVSLSCLSEFGSPSPLPDIDGLLVVSSAGLDASKIYQPATTASRGVGWPEKSDVSLLCRGSGDTLLLISDFDPDGNITIGDYQRYLYKWRPPYPDLSLVQAASGDGYRCWRLDHDPQTRRYLYSGTFDGLCGTFLLDSAFGLIEVLSGGEEARNALPCGSAFFLNDSTYLVCTERKLYTHNSEGDTSLIVSADRLWSCSRSSQSFIYYLKEGPTGERAFYLMRYPSMENTQIVADDVRCRSSNAISPDGRYLAYVCETSTWYLDSYVGIYEIETGELTNTWVSSLCRPLLWLDSLGVDWHK